MFVTKSLKWFFSFSQNKKKLGWQNLQAILQNILFLRSLRGIVDFYRSIEFKNSFLQLRDENVIYSWKLHFDKRQSKIQFCSYFYQVVFRCSLLANQRQLQKSFENGFIQSWFKIFMKIGYWKKGFGLFSSVSVDFYNLLFTLKWRFL